MGLLSRILIGTAALGTLACLVVARASRHETVAASAASVGDNVWFHETWSTGDKSHTSHGIRWGGVNSAPADKGPEVTAVNPAPGRTHSLQFEFGGSPDPGDDAFSEQRFILGNRPQELYICWDLYLPGPGDRHKGTAAFHQRKPKGPGNNKLLRLWDDRYEKKHVGAGLSFMPKPNRPGEAQLTVEYMYQLPTGRQQTKTNFGPWTVIFHDGTKGRWNRLGFHARLASGPGANDGLIEVSMNGKALGRYPNLAFRSHGQNAKNYFGNGYLLGWANSGYDETTRFWIGDVIIGPEKPEGC